MKPLILRTKQLYKVHIGAFRTRSLKAKRERCVSNIALISKTRQELFSGTFASDGM